MRLTLGRRREAGCGTGVIIGLLAGATVVFYQFSNPPSQICGLWVLPVLASLPWFAFVGGLCGYFGASVRSRAFAAIGGATIAIAPFIIIRLSGGADGIWRISSAEIMHLILGSLAGFAGNLVAARAAVSNARLLP